jgi:hypothetical protein
VWSTNGALLATKKIASESDAITCLTLSRGPDWMDTNVIATGHKDGSLKLWSVFIPAKHEETNKEGQKIPFELILRAQLLSHTKAITHVYIPKKYVTFPSRIECNFFVAIKEECSVEMNKAK